MLGVAATADILAWSRIGGNEQTSRDSVVARNHMGDRTTLDLIGRQEGLINALQMTGKPIAVVLFNGSPALHQFTVAKRSGDFGMLVSRPRNAGAGGGGFYSAISNPGGKLPHYHSAFRGAFPPAL